MLWCLPPWLQKKIKIKGKIIVSMSDIKIEKLEEMEKKKNVFFNNFLVFLNLQSRGFPLGGEKKKL